MGRFAGLYVAITYRKIELWQLILCYKLPQVDFLQHPINICKIKFSELKYTISKDYADNLRNKMSIFAADTATNKTLSLVMVTTYGVVQGKNSGIVNNEVVMDDLFKIL